jgi:hypothetical protein
MAQLGQQLVERVRKCLVFPVGHGRLGVELPRNLGEGDVIVGVDVAAEVYRDEFLQGGEGGGFRQL